MNNQETGTNLTCSKRSHSNKRACLTLDKAHHVEIECMQMNDNLLQYYIRRCHRRTKNEQNTNSPVASYNAINAICCTSSIVFVSEITVVEQSSNESHESQNKQLIFLHPTTNLNLNKFQN